jgi:hypothetical protein
MKDPRPLLREGASDFERQLLSAAMRERPSPQMRSRMRLALGLTGPLAWASSVKAMLTSLAGKGAIGVAVVGLVAAGAIGLGSTYGGADDDVQLPAVPAVAPPSAARVVEDVPPAPSAEEERASPEKEAASNGELREEILLLDQARTALQGGSGAAALAQLDRYRSRFPSGILSREAAVLRQQALAASGPRSRRTH